MADKVEVAPKSLEDFFAKNKKKKIKGSNLNTDASKTPGEEQKGKAAKEKDEERDEEPADIGLKVQVAGKLLREDDKKDEAQHTAAVWKTRNTEPKKELDDRRYPTLRKAVGQSSNINMDDGSATQVNIKTHKNAFQALDDEDEDDVDTRKGPKEIKPFLATKQKGEMMSSMIQREVEKHGGQKGGPAAAPEKKKKKKKEKEVSSSEDEDASEDEREARKKKVEVKKPEKQEDEEEQEDVKIVPDLEESRKKYQGRQKLPKKKLPSSEHEAEKENKKPAAAAASKGKKKGFLEEDEENTKSKLMVAPDDWVA